MAQFASRTSVGNCNTLTDEATCHSHAKYRNDGTVTPCEWGGASCTAKYATEFRYGCPPPPPTTPTVEVKVSGGSLDAPYYTFDPPLIIRERWTSLISCSTRA